MKIYLCNIVSGDREYEPWFKMIQSFKPYVDGIYVTANGKETTKIEQYCKQAGINYSHLPWDNDFSAQRNFNFAQVAEDADFIVWADSDDVLIGGTYLRKMAELAKKKQLDTLYLSYWYGCKFLDGITDLEHLQEVELHHFRERLIKPGTIVWKKRIHETPVPVEGLDYKYAHLTHLPEKENPEYPVAIMHTGADRNIDEESLQERMDRNQKMLELELEDEYKTGKPDPRTILYLMKIYAESEDKEILTKCLSMGKEYLALSGWDEERATCFQLMATCAGKLGDDNLSCNFLHSAIKEYPHNPLYHLMLSESYYNLKKYREMKFWLDSALSIKMDDRSATMVNTLQMKELSTQLQLKHYYWVEKDIDKAYELSKVLYSINPCQESEETVNYLQRLSSLNAACRHVDELADYLVANNDELAIEGLINALPSNISGRPFAAKLINKYGKPKKWKHNEICYVANFGKAFEEWGPANLRQGIGGSETAVIMLAKEWTKLGYKVTVYGDPGSQEGEHDGVTYLPYYKFNQRDHFNILIQWRSNSLAGKVNCKKFIIDLHDLWSEIPYLDKLDAIDYIMVKSHFHRSLAPNIPDNKFIVVGNGINEAT